LQRPAEIVARTSAAAPSDDADDAPRAAAPALGEVFVRAIDLPTPSLRQARSAVAQQIDILSPLPPAETATSLVLLGPAEGGLSRFAVGFVQRARLWEPDDRSARPIALTGWLDGQEIEFRFEPGGAGARAASPGARLEAATVAGVCLAILLAAANVRVDREIDRVRAQDDAATSIVQRRTAEAAAENRVAAAWRAASVARRADVVDCALAGAAKAAGGPVKLAKLSLAGGQVTLRLASPLADPGATAMRALGFTPVSTASPDPTAPPTVQTFEIGAAECR
jgi:hypothetical protein